MTMRFEEALEWIHGRLKLGIKPGLKRMEWLMSEMGHPEKKIKAVHVAGTNGKGSTVTYIRSILQEAGYTAGTFTSPYIETFNERISVNGKPISDREIAELVEVIKPLAERLEAETELGPVSEFEAITAMAFYYFAEVRKVDMCVFEVGLGGRLDSTNVLTPLLSVITSIGLDHTQILGDTISQIAFEKAGIIKKGVPVICSAKQSEALDVISRRAADMNAPIMIQNQDFKTDNLSALPAGEQFSFYAEQENFENLSVSMLGIHQVENAATAVMAALYLKQLGWRIREESIRSGLVRACWPGRMELVRDQPAIILDGAHNPEGMKAFVRTMKKRYADKKLTVVFTALRDKDLSEMFSILSTLPAQIYFTEFDFPRASRAADLLNKSGLATAKADSDWRTLLRNLSCSIGPDEVLAVTGSLYFISEVKMSGILGENH